MADPRRVPPDTSRDSRTVIDTMPLSAKLWLALSLLPTVVFVWIRSGGRIVAIALGVSVPVGLLLRRMSARGHHATPLWYGIAYSAIALILVAFVLET